LNPPTNEKRKLKRPLVSAVIAVSLGVAVGAIAKQLVQTPTTPQIDTTSADSLRTTPKRDSVLVVAVLTKSSCAACQSPRFRALTSEIAERAREVASAAGLRLHLHGIAADENPGDSNRYLSRPLPFDEYSFGRGWLNRAAYSPFWADQGAVASVPQVIIVREATEVGTAGMLITGSDTIRRAIGIDEVINPATV
jgi:hypothetical protein